MTEPQPDQPGLLLGSGQINYFSQGLGRLVPVRDSGTRAGQQMQFDAGAGGFSRAAQGLAFLRSPKAQCGIGVVLDTARFAPHELAEQRVDKVQNRLPAAEILDQRNGAAATPRPSLGVRAKNAGIGQAKAVNALLDVADEEPVGLRVRPADHLQNEVLSRIDVLVLVNEHEAELLAPLPSDAGWSARALVVEQPQGMLFEILKIDHAEFAFGVGEGLGELASQT